MPLKTIAGVKLNAPKSASKSDIPVIHVKGDLISRYNDTKKAYDKAEATLKELRPFVLDEALPAIYAHNCDPNCLKVIASVKVQDEKGEQAQVQFQNKYSTVDPEPVEAVFEELGADINDHVIETLKAKFDSTIWLDASGNFNKKVYEQFRVAIERVAKELKLVNEDGSVRNPFTAERVVVPRSDFHERRFKAFTEDKQAAVTEVLPNTVLIKPEPKPERGDGK